MKVIYLTQGLVTIIDDEDYNKLSKYNWHAVRGNKDKTFYAVRWSKTVNGKRYIISMAREIMETPANLEVDHINHYGLDNKKENLRNCTHIENNNNRRGWGKSRVMGVQWDKNRSKWRVRWKGKFYGEFNNEEDAAKVANSVRK